MTRGKFQLIRKTEVNWNKNVREYTFIAVYNDGTPENKRFHKYIPMGSIDITVDNPNVQFELNKYYYVDFSEVQNG